LCSYQNQKKKSFKIKSGPEPFEKEKGKNHQLNGKKKEGRKEKINEKNYLLQVASK